MYTDLKWKIPLILFAILGSAYLAYPLKDKIALGLDLQGGMHLVLEVQTKKPLKQVWNASQMILSVKLRRKTTR